MLERALGRAAVVAWKEIDVASNNADPSLAFELVDAPQDRSKASPAEHTILLVDDEVDILRALQAALRPEGHRLLTARHGWEGLAVLEHEPITVIISDQHMARVKGTEFLRAVRERWPEVIRILLTNFADPDAINAALSEGEIHRFMAKPWNDVDLRLTVRNAIAQHELLKANRVLQAQVQAQQAEISALHNQLGQDVAETVGHSVGELKLREREWEAVGRVMAIPCAVPRLADMLLAALNQVLKVFNVSGAALALRNSVTGECVIEGGRGEWVGLAGLRLAPDANLPSYLMTTGSPYVTADIHADGRFEQPPLFGSSRAVAGIPLIAFGETIGALWMGRTAPITEKEVRLLVAVGDVAAHLIYRASRQEEVEENLQRLTVLRTIDQAVATNPALTFTLNTVLEHLVAYLQVSAADVLLLNPDTQTLDYAAGLGFHSSAAGRLSLPAGAGLAGQAAQQRAVVTTQNLAEVEPPPEGETFMAYAAVPLVAKEGVVGVLEIFHHTSLDFTPSWLDFLKALATQAALAIYNAKLIAYLQHSNAELRAACDSLVESWPRLLERRDPGTGGNMRETINITLHMAQALGMSESEQTHMRQGILLHDIGKILLPDSLLNNQGALSKAEWSLMRQHPTYAYELLAPVAFLQPVLDIPYCHHEAWDGSGYPRGLKGEAIPLAARIFAMVDVWNALRSDRPYRKGWPEGKAIEYIRSQVGKLFDPKVAYLFMKLWENGELDPDE